MRIITRQKLRDALEAHGIMPMEGSLIWDERYVLPELSWLCGPYAEALRGFYSALAIGAWLPEMWDCDNFARLDQVFASILHRRTPGAPEAELLFGSFAFIRDRDEMGHAVNFTLAPIAPGADILAPVFFEPQTQALLSLSRKEIASCVGYIV